MRAYLMDLRERDAGLMAATVAENYHVSGSWVRWLRQRRRETGEVAPRRQRHGPHPMLESQPHTLAALIAEQPDRTLAELKDGLGTPASLATIWRAVQGLGLRDKENAAPRPNTIDLTSPQPAPPGTRTPQRGIPHASCSSTKPVSRPVCYAVTGGRPAASASMTACRVPGGRPARFWPRSGSPASRRRPSSRAPSMGRRFAPTPNRSSWCRFAPATS
jgi:hypothetical protein